MIHNYFKAEAHEVCRGMSEFSSDALGAYLRLGFTAYATFMTLGLKEPFDFRDSLVLLVGAKVGSSVQLFMGLLVWGRVLLVQL